MLSWPEGARHSYGRNFLSLAERGLGAGSSTNGGVKGSPARELHNAVFDAMAKARGGVINVGVGAGMYEFVGRWVPGGLVAWMMGVRKVDKLTSRVGSTGGSENGSEEGGELMRSQHYEGVYSNEERDKSWHDSTIYISEAEREEAEKSWQRNYS
jgi:hypothetical protein